jgi:glycosyltransferase A (GT-A) superfamily protein (DUF2064 family)
VLQNQVTQVIVCKRPKLYQGKQRIAKTLGAEVAYKLSQAFLRCALEDLSSWSGPVVISPADEEDCLWAESLLEKALVIPQAEGNLGERLQKLDQRLRDLGHRHILFLGTDVPMLTAEHYAEAQSAFPSADVVLSPASDGGVTLMGSSKGWPDLKGLHWSTGSLGKELVDACQDEGLNVSFIKDSYDIDEEADLKRLYVDLQGDERPQRIALLKQLHTLIEIENKETEHA